MSVENKVIFILFYYLDAVEEEFNIKARNAIISQANTQAFERQDKVKAFKTKMMLWDVGNEQKQQMKLKQKRETREKQIDKEWISLEQKQMTDYDEKLKVKLENNYNK